MASPPPWPGHPLQLFLLPPPYLPLLRLLSSTHTLHVPPDLQACVVTVASVSYTHILWWDVHIKECHFQRSRVSHAHKCCPDTWSGKIKTACLPVHVLCGGYDCGGRCLRCPFPFLLPSRFFFHCCREVLIHSFC